MANKKQKSNIQQLEATMQSEWWPLEKDRIYNPDRMGYIRRAEKPKGCVFCIAAEKKPSKKTLLLYKDDKVLVILNKYPYNNGHLLVLPNKHCGDLVSLSKTVYIQVMLKIKDCVGVLQQEYQCQGLNIGMNHGRVAGAGIPDHLHWHVIPRWTGDTNFFPIIAETKILPETVEQMYQRLAPYFKS